MIKIKRKMYFKPRRCPECHKICLFVRTPKAKCCPKCHKKQRRISKRANKRHQRRTGTYKYGAHYQSVRKRVIRNHPYCALCGTTMNLTMHHVGGGCEHFTVLCDRCHQEYERLNNKRKDKKCTRKNGIKRIIKNAKEVYLGIRLVAVRRHIRSKRLEVNAIC